jgi:excisionase family DNA binding protein
MTSPILATLFGPQRVMLQSMLTQADVPRHAYSLDEAARSISLSRRALYRLIDSGELKTIKLGSRRVVPRDELERLCRPQEHKA